MTFELMLKAFAVTYLISTIIFFICTYLGMGEKHERVLYVLLWPLFLTLVGLNLVLATLNEGVIFLLETIWPDENYQDDDDDEGDEESYNER